MLFDQHGQIITPGQAPRIWTPPRRRIELPNYRRRQRPALEAAIAHVQTSTLVVNAGGTGSSVALTTTVGNYLIASSSYFANAGALTVSDDKSNTWAAAIISTSIGGSFNLSSIWYAKVTTGGATNIAWTLPSGSYLSAGVAEFSGLAASSVLDKTDVASGNTSAGPDDWPDPAGSLATGTLSQADELVVTALCSNTIGLPSIDAFTPSGFSSLFTNPDGSTYEYGDGRYKIVSATTDIQPSWDFSGSIVCTGCIATFKAVGAATPSGNRQFGFAG